MRERRQRNEPIRTAADMGLDRVWCIICSEETLHHHAVCIHCGHNRIKAIGSKSVESEVNLGRGRYGNQRAWRALNTAESKHAAFKPRRRTCVSA